MTQIPQLPPHIDVQDDDLLVVRQSDNKDHKVPVGLIKGGSVVQSIGELRNRTGMTDGAVSQLINTGKDGFFQWQSGDMSSEVSNDPGMDFYVPPTGQDGSQGAWVRRPLSSLSVQHRGEDMSMLVDQMEIDTSNEQSFVERGLGIVSMRDHYIVRRADGRISVGHSQSEDVGADFNFVLDNDGMLLLRGGITAPVVASGVQVNAQNLQGNFSLSSTNAIDNWARDIGDSFELSFAGTELWFNHRVDNRGGVWKFTVDGTEEVTISTWRNIPKENWYARQSLIATGLSQGAHTVSAEYMGQDPDGTYVEASRGWLTMPVYPQYSTATASVAGAPRVVVESGVRPAPLSQNSVPEFAIHCRPSSRSSWSRVWVPNHGSVNTGVCRDIQRNIIVDGVDIGSDPSVISAVSKSIETVLIRQSYTAYNTSDTSGTDPMWHGHIVHKYESGVMTVTHSIDTLTDVDTDRGYMSMFPTDYRYTKQARSIRGWGKVIEPVDQGTDIPYTRTFAFLDPDTGNGAVYDCSSIGGPVNLDNQWCFFEERTTSYIAKLYPVAFNNEIIPSGQRFTSSARYALISGNSSVGVL